MYGNAAKNVSSSITTDISYSVGEDVQVMKLYSAVPEHFLKTCMVVNLKIFECFEASKQCICRLKIKKKPIIKLNTRIVFLYDHECKTMHLEMKKKKIQIGIKRRNKTTRAFGSYKAFSS